MKPCSRLIIRLSHCLMYLLRVCSVLKNEASLKSVPRNQVGPPTEGLRQVAMNKPVTISKPTVPEVPRTTSQR